MQRPHRGRLGGLMVPAPHVISALSAVVGLSLLFRATTKCARHAMTWLPRSQQFSRRIIGAKRYPAARAERFDPLALATMSEALTTVLADLLALYGKMKYLQCRVSAQHIRDQDVVLDNKSESPRTTTNAIGERIKGIAGLTLDRIGQIARLQRIVEEGGIVTAQHVLADLCEGNRFIVIMQLAGRLRLAHSLCDENGDGASATLIEECIDEAEHYTRVVLARPWKEGS
jgi:starvation-inducible DNA-binding protein